MNLSLPQTNLENAKPLVIYVDVDDTFVRSASTKRVPMPATLRHIRALYEQGATLYCWSSGGADYARQSAREFGIEACFEAFLPKPNALLDDQSLSQWRGFKTIHLASCEGKALGDYR